MSVKLRVILALFSGLVLCAAVGDMSGVSVTVQGFTRTLAQWLSLYNVVIPTNTSADVTNLQNAVNGVLPVKMAGGTFQVCSQVALPVNQRVEGIGTYSNPGSNGPSTSNSKTIVTCPTNGTFSSGQAYFALKDHDTVDGIDFYCNSGLNPQYNGVNALNAISIEFKNSGVYFCKEGISRFSNGSIPGASESFSQLARIHDNIFYENTGYGYLADFSNAGFVSDDMIYNNDFVLAGGSTGGIYVNFVASFQINNNRCEVGGLSEPCIDVENSGKIVITANNFEQTQALLINHSDSVTVTGNYGNSNTFGALLNVEFAGANTNIQFAGNTWTGASILYKVDAGGSFDTNSSFAEYFNAASTIYNDAYTQNVMQPLTAASASVVRNITPNVAMLSPVGGNHISSRGFAPTLSSCGTSPSVAGDDSAGVITTGTGSPTACTVTFAAPYTVAPQCTATTNATGSVAAISPPSTSAFTVSLSATATKISYQCMEQVPNILTGGVGLTSVWTTQQSTLTTAAGTSPSGANDAASLVEDSTSSATHDIYQVNSKSSGTYTMSAYVKAATGTDNVDLLVIDSGLSNSIGAVFNPSTGAFVGTASNISTGSAVLISTGSQALSGSWYRVWMVFSGFSPNYEQVNLARGTTINFNGNGTNNVLVWGPAIRAGTLP